jgi:SAM-dependent methyltransferase
VLTMLYHVPTIELQDRLIREARRVLRPGGIFAGSDSRWGPLFALAHLGEPYKSSTPACSPNDLARRASRKSTLAYELQRFTSTPLDPVRTKLSWVIGSGVLPASGGARPGCAGVRRR